MFKKAFKTIFILTLCLGITLPANAGGANVSDGSAFITKSELAYELNNLSNRMTQLENSLDSRIDVLVSSYLTRNGIWNAANQALAINYYWLSLSNSATLTTNYTFQNGRYGFQGKTASNYHPSAKVNFRAPSTYSAGTYYRVDFVSNIELIREYNKSGMLVLNLQNGNPYTWSGTFGQDNRDVYVPIVTDHRFIGLSGMYMEFLSGSSGNEKLVNTLTLSNGQIDLTDSSSLHYGLLSNINVLRFFVNKDERLIFNMYWNYQGAGVNCSFGTNKDFVHNATANWGPAVYFLDASVY